MHNGALRRRPRAPDPKRIRFRDFREDANEACPISRHAIAVSVLPCLPSRHVDPCLRLASLPTLAARSGDEADEEAAASVKAIDSRSASRMSELFHYL